MSLQENKKMKSVLRTREKLFLHLFTYPFLVMCFPETEDYYNNEGDDDIVCYSRLFYIALFITWCLTNRKNRRHTSISSYIFSLFKLIKEEIVWKLKWKLIFGLFKISNKSLEDCEKRQKVLNQKRSIFWPTF